MEPGRTVKDTVRLSMAVRLLLHLVSKHGLITSLGLDTPARSSLTARAARDAGQTARRRAGTSKCQWSACQEAVRAETVGQTASAQNIAASRCPKTSIKIFPC